MQLQTKAGNVTKHGEKSAQSFVEFFSDPVMQKNHSHSWSSCRSFLDSFSDILKYDTPHQTMDQKIKRRKKEKNS